MRLITVEDYATLHKLQIKEVHDLIKRGDLKTYSPHSIGLKRIYLIYVESVPNSIPSLDARVKYLNQQSAAHRLGVRVEKVREKIRKKEIDSIKLKNFYFIPESQFEHNMIESQEEQGA